MVSKIREGIAKVQYGNAENHWFVLPSKLKAYAFEISLAFVFRIIHNPIAQNKTIITIPSVPGEKKKSVPGLNEIKFSKTKGAFRALIALCARNAGQSEPVFKRSSPNTSAVGKIATKPITMKPVTPRLLYSLMISGPSRNNQ